MFKRTKEELLKQVAIEREKRERERKQQLSAIKIQSAWKSFLARKKLVKIVLNQFKIII